MDVLPVKTKYAMTAEGKRDGWLIKCPACGFEHHFDSRWNWNESFDKPSFMPPLHVLLDPGVCHFQVLTGTIIFERDCTHAMAGKTVELPDIV